MGLMSGHHTLCVHSADEACEGRQRYAELDGLIRKVLWLRALAQGGSKYADAALGKRDAFVQVCLLAERQDGKAGAPPAEQSLQVSLLGHTCIYSLWVCSWG